MKQESHRQLGRSLIARLPERPSRLHTHAFLLGCVEPDSNPLSYLKGSLRERWFYGHNYQNAYRWIDRAIRRLESRRRWRFWHYYRMGKLIHYTSDAFTYVHNNCFTESIGEHRAYEWELQDAFLKLLEKTPLPACQRRRDLRTAFHMAHAQYLQKSADVHRDCSYILDMTGQLFRRLLPEAA